MEMGEGQKKRGASSETVFGDARTARNWMLYLLAFLLIANPEGGNQSSSSGMCLAEQVSRRAPSRLAGRSSSTGGGGLLPALSRGSKKKHALLSQDDTARRRPSPSGGLLSEEEEDEEEEEGEMAADLHGYSSYYGEDDEAVVDLLEKELYGTKHRLDALPEKVLKPQTSRGKGRETAANFRRYSKDSEESEDLREHPSVSSGAVDEIERELQGSEMSLGKVVHRGDSASHGGDGRGRRRAIKRGEGHEHREYKEHADDDDDDDDDEQDEEEGGNDENEYGGSDGGGDDDEDQRMDSGRGARRGKGKLDEGDTRCEGRTRTEKRAVASAKRSKGRVGENMRIKDFGSVKHLKEDDAESERDHHGDFSISLASSIDSEEQGSSVLREDSSSRMGSFDEDLEGSSLSGHSEGDSCSGNAEELIKALEAKATRAPALPIGAGDALYNNLTQNDEGIDPLYFPEGMVQQKRPEDMAKEAAGSTALMLDEAGKLGERFANDYAIINNVPFKRDDDGPSGIMIESQKNALMQRFLYGGMVTGDKNRESLQKMLHLPLLENKHEAAVSAIKPGENGDKARERGGAEEDMMVPGGLMLAESQAQTDSKMAVVPAEHAAGSLVSHEQREGGGGGGAEEADVFGMWDPVPQEALIAQPGSMQPHLDEREKDLVMIKREFITTSSTNASYEDRKLHPAVVPRWALEHFGGEAYAGVLARKEKNVGELMRETDGHGNTVKALMLCGDRQMSLSVPLSGKQLAIAARKEADKIPENVTRLRKWAEEMSNVDAKQFVEMYRPEVRKLAAGSLKGASKAVHMIQEAARKVGMPKARKGRLSMSHAGTREAVKRGEAIPRNTRIPLKILRGIRGSLKKKYKRAKERAKEMDMDITPELVKARDALRYSAGTRNDVIAKGAVFGKTAELMETRKREDRARGKRRRGPDGLMNRPS